MATTDTVEMGQGTVATVGMGQGTVATVRMENGISAATAACGPSASVTCGGENLVLPSRYYR
jgi:hypothetical protein